MRPATNDATAIPVGGSATINVHFQAPLTAGIVGHAVRFHTNDPDHEYVMLTFQVLVRRAIETVPPNLFTGPVMCGTEVSHNLELCSTDGAPFEVKKFMASASWIHVTPLDTVSNRHSFRVTIDCRAPVGSFSESLKFVTSRPRQEELVVPIRGEVVSPFSVSPASLLLRNAQAGSIVDAKLLIGSPQEVHYAVHSVDTQHKEWQLVSWQMERISDTRSYLRLRVRVPDAAGYKRTSLILKPSRVGPEQRIPMSCMVAEKERPKQ